MSIDIKTEQQFVLKFLQQPKQRKRLLKHIKRLELLNQLRISFNDLTDKQKAAFIDKFPPY